MAKNNTVVPSVGTFYKDEENRRVVVFYVDPKEVKYAYEGQSTEFSTDWAEFGKKFTTTDVIGPDVTADNVTSDAPDQNPVSENKEKTVDA